MRRGVVMCRCFDDGLVDVSGDAVAECVAFDDTGGVMVENGACAPG